MDPSGDIIGKVKCVVSMDEKLDETLMKLQLLKPLIGASMYHDWRTSFMDNVENTFDEDAVATLEIKLRIVQNDLRDIPDDILSHPLARHLGGRDSSLGTNFRCCMKHQEWSAARIPQLHDCEGIQTQHCRTWQVPSPEGTAVLVLHATVDIAELRLVLLWPAVVVDIALLLCWVGLLLLLVLQCVLLRCGCCCTCSMLLWC